MITGSSDWIGLLLDWVAFDLIRLVLSGSELDWVDWIGLDRISLDLIELEWFGITGRLVWYLPKD